MPITRSAKKALRKSRRRAAQNLKKKEAYKKVSKQVRKLVSEKKIDQAQTLMAQAYKTLDKAAKTGVIKKNTARRKKSRLAGLIKKARAATV